MRLTACALLSLLVLSAAARAEVSVLTTAEQKLPGSEAKVGRFMHLRVNAKGQVLFSGYHGTDKQGGDALVRMDKPDQFTILARVGQAYAGGGTLESSLHAWFFNDAGQALVEGWQKARVFFLADGQTHTPILKTGGPAPGGNISNSRRSPTTCLGLNAKGHALFTAYTEAEKGDLFGLFLFDGEVLIPVARAGDPVKGGFLAMTRLATDTNALGGTPVIHATYLDLVRLGDDGSVDFRASVRDAATPRINATHLELFHFDGKALKPVEPVAKPGDKLGNLVLNEFLAVRPPRTALFAVPLPAEAGGKTGEQVLLRCDGKALSVVARPREAGPEGLGTIVAIGESRLTNAAGQSAFDLTITLQAPGQPAVAGGRSTEQVLVFLDAKGKATTVARSGVPLGPAREVFEMVSLRGLTDDGRVVFSGYNRESLVIFLWEDGQVTELVRRGQKLPQGTLTDIGLEEQGSVGAEAVSTAGHVVFHGKVDGKESLVLVTPPKKKAR